MFYSSIIVTKYKTHNLFQIDITYILNIGD